MHRCCLILLLAGLPTLGGCMTIGVWTDAAPNHVTSPFVTGHVSTPAGGESARPTALIVSYSLPYTFRPHAPPHLWLQVPLDASGEPAAPFAYRGLARTPDEVLRDLKPEQIAAARAATARAEFGEGHTPKLLPGFSDAYVGGQHAKSSGVLVFVYWISPAGVVSPVFENQPWPPEVHVAIVPVEAARPPGHKVNATLRALVLTPVMIGLDVVSIPLVVVAIFTGNIC